MGSLCSSVRDRWELDYPACCCPRQAYIAVHLPACSLPSQSPKEVHQALSPCLHAYMSMSLLVFKLYRHHPRLWTKRPSRPHSRHLKGELKARLFKNRNTSRPNRPLRMWIRAQAVCTLHLSLVLSRRTSSNGEQYEKGAPFSVYQLHFYMYFKKRPFPVL